MRLSDRETIYSARACARILSASRKSAWIARNAAKSAAGVESASVGSTLSRASSPRGGACSAALSRAPRAALLTSPEAPCSRSSFCTPLIV